MLAAVMIEWLTIQSGALALSIAVFAFVALIAVRDFFMASEQVSTSVKAANDERAALKSIGYNDKEQIALKEQHLNILDQKATALLIFSLSYVGINIGFIQYAAIAAQGGASYIFGVVTLTTAAFASTWLFLRLVVVKWQDYSSAADEVHGEARAVVCDLTIAKARRTIALRRVRSMYVFSIGSFFAMVLTRYLPVAVDALT